MTTPRGGAELMARLRELARFSADPDAMTRLYLTPEHKQAAAQVDAWMREAGMSVHMDAVGTVVGRYEASTPDAPALLLGSHIDTVRNAGIYDGNLGVLAAIEAVHRLNEAGERLPFAIEVLVFGDEEGVRFPVTLTSSRAVAGILDMATLDAMDGEDITIREALAAFGCDPAGIASIARDRAKVLGYVEVHIEQGPVLESQDLPVGIVTAISGASRAVVKVKGVAGHAGTVPMMLRHDAGAAAAEMVLEVERQAPVDARSRRHRGRLKFQPGAVNMIPSVGRFLLDCRSSVDAVRVAGMASLKKAFEAHRQAAGRDGDRSLLLRRAGGRLLARDRRGARSGGRRAGRAAVAHAQRRGSRRVGHGGALPHRHALRALQGRHQPQPRRIHHPADAGVAVDVLVDFLRRFRR